MASGSTSDDGVTGPELVLPIPAPLRQPIPGIRGAVTALSRQLGAMGPQLPLPALWGCATGGHTLSVSLAFDPATPGAPAAPLPFTSTVPCTAGAPPLGERADPFGARLAQRSRKRLKLRRLGSDVEISVLCGNRCGGRGAVLARRVAGAPPVVTLTRRIRPRAVIEVVVREPGHVPRMEVLQARRGRSFTRLGASCLDAAGIPQQCTPGTT